MNLSYQHAQDLSSSPSTLVPDTAHHDDHLETSSQKTIMESPKQNSSHGKSMVFRRNPPRTRHPPEKSKDYVAHSIRYPVNNFVSYRQLSPRHTAFLTTISNVSKPKNFQEAKSQVVWQKAMDEELTALAENKTWTVVPLPPGKHAVGSRWVFKIKFNSDESIDRHKARLVAQGFTQKFGVEYKETLAPVTKMTMVRVLFPWL